MVLIKTWADGLDELNLMGQNSNWADYYMGRHVRSMLAAMSDDDVECMINAFI
jgi:hypothetical protein